MFLLFANLIFNICNYKYARAVRKYKCLDLLNAHSKGAPEADFCKNPVLPDRWQEEGIYAILSE